MLQFTFNPPKAHKNVQTPIKKIVQNTRYNNEIITQQLQESTKLKRNSQFRPANSHKCAKTRRREAKGVSVS